MSAEGPESIPTSADPRSKRPTKRRALTPVSAQAASVGALFAKPDQDIRIPPSLSSLAPGSKRPPPPEIVTNVQGSSAGAGSGEFHVYKAARRREYERLKEMDEEVKRECEQAEFEKGKVEKDLKDEEKTRKNREKRDKAKARKAKKGKGGGGNGDNAKGPNGNGDKAPAVPGSDEGRRENGASTRNANGAGRNGSDQTVTEHAEPAVGLVIHDDD
ncbi:hypothetical protein Trco_005818 [Trichoderma cornu-damae]|uniref:DUF1168-domain-containing protein n=1 Tax=Trichoderma cornu-damae TaxID=654480 RepID=A0A9P8QHX7_9HYPO|nr:hypothetical protein Trco_005818 [Trichoderma cornu-damae]